MIGEERRKQIIRMIKEKGSININELIKHFHVSAMTLRRDLTELHKQGYIRRVHGGAVINEKEKYSLIDYDIRMEIHVNEKDMIACYAVDNFIRENDIIILEGGTTVSRMAKYLKIPHLTVLTNSPKLISYTYKFLRDLKVMCCGGVLIDKGYTFIGSDAVSFFNKYYADKCFVSGVGLTLEHGLTDIFIEEIEVKNSIIKSARECIVLLDSSKFGITSLMPTFPLNKINKLITDSKAPRDILKNLEKCGIEIHVVEV